MMVFDAQLNIQKYSLHYAFIYHSIATLVYNLNVILLLLYYYCYYYCYCYCYCYYYMQLTTNNEISHSHISLAISVRVINITSYFETNYFRNFIVWIFEYRKWSIKPPLLNKPPPLKLILKNRAPSLGAYSNLRVKRLFSVYGQKEHYIRLYNHSISYFVTLRNTWFVIQYVR